MLRLLGGEDVDVVAKELGVDRLRLERWRADFEAGGKARLSGLPRRYWVAGATGLLVLAILLSGFFLFDLCDSQLAANGSPVEVCRHLQITDPPLAAAGLVLLLVLSAFFTELSGFGITLKRDVKDAKAQAEKAGQEAGLARQRAEELDQRTSSLTEWGTDLGEQVKDLKERGGASRGTGLTGPMQADPTGSVEAEGPLTGDPPEQAARLRTLAARYNEIRWMQPSGPDRTREMTNVVRGMRDVSRGLTGVDVQNCLQSGDRGVRLSAYAYLLENPDPTVAHNLAECLVEREDKPFGQYWGLQALTEQVTKRPDVLGPADLQALDQRFGPLPATTDRGVEYRRLRSRIQPARQT